MPHEAHIHIHQLPDGAGWRVWRAQPDATDAEELVCRTAAQAWEVVKLFAEYLIAKAPAFQVQVRWHPIDQLGQDVVNQIKAQIGGGNPAERN